MGRFKDKQIDVLPTVEWHRINDLPRRVVSDVELEHMRVELTKALRRPGGTMELRPKQAHALHDIGVNNGAVLIMAVGQGKTLCSLLAPAVMDPLPRRPLLITKASLIGKTKDDYDQLLEHWLLPTNMQMQSYEFLGRVSGSDFLEITCEPDLIIFDEAHFVKSLKAGVTRRLVRYLKSHPDTRVVIMSGTLLKASTKDAAHLIRWALKDKSPVPAHANEVDQWANALDAASRVNVLERCKPGALLEFARPEDWQPRTPDEKVTPLIAARRGYQRRLIETPGVVATGGDQVDCSLNIIGRQYDPNEATERNFQHLRSTWCTPDDWQLMQAMEVWATARQLALGFHYTWLDADRWRECLIQTQKRNDCGLSNTELAILNAFAHTTVNETEISKVLEHLREKKTEHSGTDTRSHWQSTKRSTPSSTGSVTSVANAKGLERSLSTLITTMQLGGSGGSSATTATSLSACLEILSRVFPALFNILREAETAARPPIEWRCRKKAWEQFVRETLKYSRKLDTPYQIALACKEGALDSEALDAWEEIRPSFTPRSKAVFHDDTALRICQDYAEKTPGIIWTEHSLFGLELSKRTGLPYFGREGLDADGNDLNVLARKVLAGEEKPRPIICSRPANATGRNLQGWNDNLITSIPTEAAVWEQLLGRTHRTGQRADEVNVTTLFGCFEHLDGWLKAVELAEATQDVEGTSQKLCIATKIVPPVAYLPGPRWTKTADEHADDE